jgi:hypothetical protein
MKFFFAILPVAALTLLQGCFPKITPMMKMWPIVYYPTRWQVPVEAVFLVTKRDTVEGYTKLAGGLPVIARGVTWELKNVKYVDIESVRYMRLYNYDFNSHFFELRRLSYGHLYRSLAEEGKAGIYDNYLGLGEWKNRTLLVAPQDTIQLFSWFAFMSHFGNKRPLLLKFIKRRFHVKVREKDFNTKQDMIKYILERENALLLTSPSTGKSAHPT